MGSLIEHVLISKPVGGKYLLRQLDHLEIPRAETVIGVDGPVGHFISEDVSVPVI